MSESFNKNLQFSIDETIWLKDGQEAAEILSLALEPDITIEENRSYVSIKGSLVLTGEYKPIGDDTEGNSASPMEEHLQFRTIDEISTSNEGTALIEHAFPVDITVPANRIEDLDDVYVLVESFDYEIPEPGCLQLYADISISGILSEPKAEKPFGIEDTELNSVYERKEDPDELPIETIRSESYKVQEEETKEEGPELDLKERPDNIVSKESVIEDTIKEKSAPESLKKPDAEEKFKKQPKLDEKPKELLKSLITPKAEVKVEEAVKRNEENIEKEESEPSSKKEQSAKSPRDENALYLTKMLANEEDQFSKVKMYIVQHGESLDHISDRYRIPVTTLLRTNRLESDSVQEGQVLYIPVSSR